MTTLQRIGLANVGRMAGVRLGKAQRLAPRANAVGSMAPDPRPGASGRRFGLQGGAPARTMTAVEALEAEDLSFSFSAGERPGGNWAWWFCQAVVPVARWSTLLRRRRRRRPLVP